MFLAEPVRLAQAAAPDQAIGVHVDDVSQTSVDQNEGKLLARVASSGIVFANAVRDRGLQISDKSVVVSTSIALSRKIANSLLGPVML